MTLKNVLISLGLILMFFSCSSDDSNNDSNPPQDDLLLAQRITDYDGDILTENFSYDGNKLTSILDSEGYEYEYIYENDLLNRINYTDSNDNLIDYVLLEYNANNQLNTYTVYIASGNEGLRFDLTYNANGTITEKEYIGDHSTQTTLIGETIITRNNGQTTMEVDGDFEATVDYDTNNGIYKNVSGIENLNLINIDFSGYIDSAENNRVKTTENDNGVVNIFEEYQYTYNTTNYPETAIYYYDGDLDSTIQYIYE